MINRVHFLENIVIVLNKHFSNSLFKFGYKALDLQEKNFISVSSKFSFRNKVEYLSLIFDIRTSPSSISSKNGFNLRGVEAMQDILHFLQEKEIGFSTYEINDELPPFVSSDNSIALVSQLKVDLREPINVLEICLKNN